ncbi:MAG TPA: protein phosphatase 2C domain-containing protein [Cellvibrio sp.]|nr:protein phosphatase 2C domain-containing protein [Cellvibrio sp.]
MTDITFRRPIVWNSSSSTHVGMVREINEDAVLAKPEQGLWAVADGMGGHLLGDVASQQIISALDAVEVQSDLSEYVNALEDAVLKVNEEMLEYAQSKFGSGTMGTTLVLLIIKERVGVCLWVGDSRLYRVRSQQLVQVTRDHSQLEEMIELGLLERESAEDYPHKNVITRAVGVENELFVDINLFTTQIGDTFLLCSDGLYNSVGEQDLYEALCLRDTDLMVSQLVDKALANGAPDNVSVVVVQGGAGKLPSIDLAQE